jgi:hypothetical protein
LAFVAAEPAQLLGLLDRFDPFGDGLQPQVGCQLEDGAHQRAVVGVLVETGDERAVDLEDLHGQLDQVGQRGVAGAEVVDRQPHIQPAELVGHLQDGVEVLHEQALGELQVWFPSTLLTKTAMGVSPPSAVWGSPVIVEVEEATKCPAAFGVGAVQPA